MIKNIWVAYNSKSNSCLVISFARLCHKLAIKTKTGVLFETEDFQNFLPFQLRKLDLSRQEQAKNLPTNALILLSDDELRKQLFTYAKIEGARFKGTNPGKLMPSVDFGEMEAGQSEIRNKTLAPVFKRLGIIEQWGNGLKLIAEELQNYPEISIIRLERTRNCL